MGDPVGADVRLDGLEGPPYTGGACSAVTLPAVDMGELTAGWAALEGVRKAIKGVTQAIDPLVAALKRHQRRMRRRAARRGTRGRRGSRSVGPWGVPWAMVRISESMGGAALDCVPMEDLRHG